MLTAVILAGGRSERMGADKGLVILLDRPLVRHVADALRTVVQETVVSVGKGMAARYRDVLGGGVVIVEDSASGRGPLEGLSQALGTASSEYCAIAPCDTPLLAPEVVRTVAGRATGHDGAVPLIRGYFEPLHGTYRREAFLVQVRRRMAQGMNRPIDCYEGLDIIEVDERVLRGHDPELLSFWNMNEPSDIRCAEQRLSQMRSTPSSGAWPP